MTAVPPLDPLVLLVDDYADAREMYAEFLKSSGYRVAEAADGAEALEKIAALAPDVILLDVSLPLIDGREVTKRVKANPATARIPVVLLSGMPLEYVKGAGADACVAKPCAPEALLAEVGRLLAARRKVGPV
jgi:two-component system cell cycle response regulator DivK